MRRWILVLVVLAWAFPIVACSPRDDAGPNPTPDGADIDSCKRFPQFCDGQTGDFLFQVGRAIATAGTYRLSAVQQDLDLPRWGGSDSGSVAVDVRTDSAVADLQRTGDGRYAVVLRGGETYFKRETCRTWTHIQAGAEVLASFVITPEEVQRARLIEVLPAVSSRSSITKVDLPGVGVVTMEVDSATSRILRITSDPGTNQGRAFEWTFDRWGEPVDIPAISSDRVGGPGGNPC